MNIYANFIKKEFHSIELKIRFQVHLYHLHTLATTIIQRILVILTIMLLIA
jgi:hypothetical protein